MNDIVYMILETVVSVVFIALMRYLFPLVIQSLRAHNYNFAADMVQTAVKAAEQIFAGAGRGEEKYTYVKKHLLEELARYKIELTEAQLNALIEAAVHAMKQEDGWLYPVEQVSE